MATEFIGIKHDGSENLEIWSDKFYKPDTTSHTRSLITQFQHFRDFYNVKFHYKVTNSYGVETLVNSGNWTGMIGHLSRRETEFCIQESRIRDDRLLVADYVVTTRVYKIFFSFLQPQSFGSYSALITPLEWQLWCALLAVTLVLIVIFKVISNSDKSCNENSWSSAMIQTLGSISAQGSEETINLVSYYVAAVALLFFAFMTTVYYSGAVLNGLLSPSKSTINTLDQLLESDFDLGLWDIVFVKDFNGRYNVYGPPSPLTTKLFDKIKRYKRLYYNIEEGVDKLSQGKFAFFSDNAYIYNIINAKLTPAQICSMSQITTISPFQLGIYSTKNSPYREHITILFQWMKEVGISAHSQVTWYEQGTPCLGTLEAIAIGIKAISSGFFILSSGMLLSVLMFVLEFKFYNKKS